MSLINDVLRDLERRQAPESASAPESAARHHSKPPARAWRWSLWLIAALALGGVLHLSLRESAPPTPSRDPAPLAAQAGSPTPPERTEAFASDDVTASAQAETPDQVPPARPTPEPEPDIPASGPERNPARAGSDSELRMSDQEDPTPDKSISAPLAEPESDPAPQPQTASVANEPASEPRISIRRSGGEKAAADPLDAVKRFLARGQFRRAESHLERIVEDQPGRTEAHQLLADTLIRQRRPSAAIDVLQAGLDRVEDPAVLAARLGRLLIESGAPGQARRVLETHAPPLSKAHDYHLLLAAAHRQAGDHAAAAAHYRELTQLASHVGAAWIGLGASLESLDRPNEAIAAYNRALDGDDARAARFARQRLAALEPMTGEEP